MGSQTTFTILIFFLLTWWIVNELDKPDSLATFSFYDLFTALNTAFGSLYCDEVVVTPATVVPILAAAHLLHLVRI